MKATDLMIGDWVRFSYPHHETGEPVVRVFQVTQIEAQLGDYYVWSEDGRVCHPEQLIPIPLTPEILEKNGFEDNPFDKRVWNWENARYHILLAQTRLHMSVRTKNKILRYDITRLPKYVHELQHALRLCGIKKEVLV